MDGEGPNSHTSSSDFSFFFSADENAVRLGDVLQHLKTNRVVISGGRDPHGGAIITFPSSANTDFVAEEFDKLMRFVSSVPSEDVQDIGFTVIADMRNKDLLATNSLLRHLQVTMVSNPQELLKFVDVRQLTVDLHGELQHDQDIWIDMQMAIESLTRDVIEIGSRYGHVDSALNMTNTATSLEEAETLLKNHDELKPLYHGSGLQPILDRFSELARKVYRSSEDGPGNPDFVAARTRLGSLLEKLESKRKKLEVNWDKRREKLESCMQWRKLESDADKLLVWIAKTMETCIKDCPNIGTTPGTTERLAVAHQQLEEATTEKRKMILSVLTESSSLLERGHYASEDIRMKSNQLQQEFGELSERLTNRNALLRHASAFHSTVFSFLHNVVEWRLNFEDKSLNGTVAAVESQIRDSKSICDLISKQFGDLQQKGVSLIEWLQNLAGKSLVASGFGLSVKHVKEFLVKAGEEKQALETLWQGKVQVLSRGLGLRLFEKEAQKVHEWLDEKGFSFLVKNKDIGDDHSTAMFLLDEHKSFESNLKAMNSTTGKLLRSSEDLASSGQCDPEQIGSVADQLEERMHNFVAQSERRREQLEMSVAFQKTVEGLLSWMDQVESDVNDISYPDSANDTKLMINDSQLKRNHSAVQTANTLAQGQSLINKLSEPLESTGGSLLPNYYENKRKIANTMERLQERHAHVDSLLADRKMKFDICLVLRTFETATHDHLQEINQYLEHCESSQLAPNVDGAVIMLQAHNDFTESIEEAYTDVTDTGHSLLSRLSESNRQLTVSSTNMKPAAVHVREILDQLAEKFSEVQAAGADRTTTLEQCLQLRDYEANVAQVTGGIADSYTALVSRPRIVAKTLEKAEALLAYHEGFEVSIEIMNDSVQDLVAQTGEFERTAHYDLVTVQQLAASLDDQWTTFAEAVDNRHSLLTMSHDVHRHHDELTSRSITLQKEFGNTTVPDSVAHTETIIEQHKEQRDFFVQECDRFISDSNQLLDQLKELALPAYCDDHGMVVNTQYEENMKRIQVMLEGMGVRQRKTLRLWEKRNRILEQLRELLGFIDDAKKITDWVYNCLQSMKAQTGFGSSLDSVDKLITDLEAYESKDIQGYHEKTLYLMERAAELQRSEHCDTGRLRVRMAVLNSSWQDLEDHLTKHKERLKLSREFHGVLSQFQTERDRVLLFLNKFTDRTDVCDSSKCVQLLMDDLNAHGEQVLPSLNSKLSRLETLSHQIQDSRVALRTDLVAAHCHALEADMRDRAEHLVKLLEQHVQIEKEKDDRKRQERRLELLLEELVQTEDQYVKDMEYVLEHYQKEMDNDGPVALMGKNHIVLGNMDEMLKFHRGTFFIALKEAGNSSEEVAKCFVTWEDRLLDLYLGYCKTKPHSEALLAEKAQNFLTEWQLSRGHNFALGAYLIKPVQRITRYHLLLRELAKYCQRLKDPMENLKKALQIMLEIPKKTNDVMNFSMVRDYEGNSDSLGQLYHQDSFTVVDSKILRSKEKEQQLFFFLDAILVCKCVRDQLGNVTRYLYRTSLKTREMMLTEFVEGEPCKFCISMSETKSIFKAKSIDAKQEAVKVVRHILQQVQPVPNHLTLDRGGLRRSLKGKKKKSISTPSTPERPGFRPTLALALASIISGGDAKGTSDAEVLGRPLSVDPTLPGKVNKTRGSTLDFQDNSRTTTDRQFDVANRSAVAGSHNLQDSGEVDDFPTRDRRETSSSPSEDEYHRSDSISAVRLTRAKVIRAKTPRVRKATIVRIPSQQQGVGVVQRVPPKKQDVGVAQSIKIPSPPQKARSASPPVLIHRSSATAMLIPGSRSASCVTSAVTSCTFSELPDVLDLDVTGRRREKVSGRVTSLKHSVSDGDLEQVI